MGVEKANGTDNAQDEGNADGAGVNIKLFISEDLPQPQQQELQDLYANDEFFQQHVDEEFSGSEFANDLQEKGCEAYDFLAKNFQASVAVDFGKQDEQDLWKKIRLHIE